MAVEKFIRKEHDNHHHDGWHANQRRKLTAEEMMEVWPELVNAIQEGRLEDETVFLPQSNSDIVLEPLK